MVESLPTAIYSIVVNAGKGVGETSDEAQSRCKTPIGVACHLKLLP